MLLSQANRKASPSTLGLNMQPYWMENCVGAESRRTARCRIYDCRFTIVDCRFAKCPPLWRLMKMLFKVRNGGLTLRDVKNEDRTGYVHENKGDDDKMSS